MTQPKLQLFYRVKGGLLDGTIIEPIMAFWSVKYPHRKTKDLYVPPLEDGKKWHCCQDCSEPDFETKDFLNHLEKHAGRLLKLGAKQ